MVVSSHAEIFLNKPVQNYTLNANINPDKFVYRVGTDDDDEGITVINLLNAFAQHPQAGAIKELIIGRFGTEYDTSSGEVVKKLVELNSVFTNLKALFIGDIAYEECEISWINQSDIGPILLAYPALEHLQVRGSNDLTFSTLQHDRLTTLIIECGGLYPDILEQVAGARLPNLQRLELWLGEEQYGFRITTEDFMKTISGILSGTTFPKLTHLGLMDSIIQDEIAIAVSNAPVMHQLKVLDLSMGTLGDTGAAALLASAAVRNLQHLNLRHHFMSDAMMQQLQGLGTLINMDEREDESKYGRYVEVSE